MKGIMFLQKSRVLELTMKYLDYKRYKLTSDISVLLQFLLLDNEKFQIRILNNGGGPEHLLRNGFSRVWLNWARPPCSYSWIRHRSNINSRIRCIGDVIPSFSSTPLDMPHPHRTRNSSIAILVDTEFWIYARWCILENFHINVCIHPRCLSPE
jgi:hypothetical protein